jgi:hypothetical protein
MTFTPIRVIRLAGIVFLLAGVSSMSYARGHGGAVPRGGGGSPRASGHATRPSGGSGGARAVAPRQGGGPGAHVARTPVSGTAHYGHGHGYGYGYGHGGYYGGYWGGWYPWWGAGYYWGWPYYGYGYYGYGYPYVPPYAIYDGGGGNDVSPDEPASIETDVSPSKAEVLLDGESVGYASDYDGRWDDLKISPGHHTISFAHKGYKTLVVGLEARPGAEYEFKDVLAHGDGEVHREVKQAAAPKDSTAGLRIAVTPEDAAVYLDGQYLGLAGELGQIHGALKIDAGEHKLEAVRPGYGSEVRTIGVEPGGVASISFTLTAQP